MSKKLESDDRSLTSDEQTRLTQALQPLLSTMVKMGLRSLKSSAISGQKLNIDFSDQA